MLNVDINIDLGGVYKKLSPSNLERGQVAMLHQMLIDMDPLVPRNQGNLAQTGTIGTDKSSLHWRTPYAAAQFKGQRETKSGKTVVFTNYTTPGTGKRWDLKAKSMFMNDWVKVYAKGAGL